MEASLDFLARAWNALPDAAQRHVERSALFHRGRLAVVRREELVWVTCRPTEDLAFELLLPERFRPWWPLSGDLDGSDTLHEPPTTRALIERVAPGDVFWDMGSQFGYFTFLAAALNDAPDRVHVFELSPYKSARLERVLSEAYGDRRPTVVNERLGTGAGDSLSGDAYSRRTGPPDAVKMDVEGAESIVVPSTAETIRESEPTLVVEVHPNKIDQHFDATEADIWDVVTDVYDDVRVCREFRSLDGTWEPRVGYEDVRAAHTQADVELHGGLDPDSYQLLCTPDA